MNAVIDPTTRHRLNVQGMGGVSDAKLAEIAPWQRMAWYVCATLAATGTALASPVLLFLLVPISLGGALSNVHPVDRIYNRFIAPRRGTGPLPLRTPQTRFACGLGTVWLIVTALMFQGGAKVAGYILGAGLTFVAGLVATTDICIPSMIYNALFKGGQPK